jgi:hypothetical protein
MVREITLPEARCKADASDKKRIDDFAFRLCYCCFAYGNDGDFRMNRFQSTFALAAVLLIANVTPLVAGKLTCEMGSEAICESFCGSHGGGVSSNPDGTTTCTYEMAAEAEADDALKSANENSWFIVKLPAVEGLAN